MIKDSIKDKLFENFRQSHCGLDYPEYVERESENDPNFFRFLFEEDFEEDFEGREEEFAEFLKELRNEFKKPIVTMYDMANWLNMCGEYPTFEVEEICEKKGWRLCDTDYEIAIDVKSNSLLCIDENTGNVEVTYYKGGAREGSGKPSRFSGEKKPLNLRLTVEAIELLTAEAKRTKVSRSDIVNRLIFKAFK